MLTKDRGHMGLGVAALGTTLALLAGGAARAEPGDHVRTGNAEITPAVEFGGEYRTNVYLEEGTLDDPTNGGANLQLHPTLDIEFKGADATIELGAGYKARKYLSRTLSDLDRFSDVEFDFGLDALPEAMVGARVQERLSYLGLETERESGDVYMERLSNVGSGQLSIHPGSALEADLGAALAFDGYSTPQTGTSAYLNSKLGWGPKVNLKWRFLPKTAIVADFEQYSVAWAINELDATGDEQYSSSEDVGSSLGIPNYSQWQATGGMRGRITNKLVLTVTGGYGKMDYDVNSVTGEDNDLVGFPAGLVVITDIGYTPIEGHTVTLGYRRDFQDAFFTNFVAFDELYGRYSGLFSDKVGFKGEGSVRFEDYVGQVTRNDMFIRTRGDVVYHTSDFLDINGGVWWTRRISADRLHPEIEYDDVNVHLGLTFTY